MNGGIVMVCGVSFEVGLVRTNGWVSESAVLESTDDIPKYLA